MSQIRSGIFGTLGLLGTLGAVQFASGHDLADRLQNAAADAQPGINRSGKADRGAVKVTPDQTETIALRFDSLADTSVVVRVPVAKGEVRGRQIPSAKPAGSRKTTVACEPPVSVLTEVAKLLEPGRCVT